MPRWNLVISQVKRNNDLPLLADFFREQGSLLCITGAGLSTESNIPDYRSPNGSYSTGHKPMTHQLFLSSEDSRQRYWARSVMGFRSFSKAKPNVGHETLTRLHSHGLVDAVITQNVDRLQHRSGMPKKSILELHGNNDEIECTGCQTVFSRPEYQQKLEIVNSAWIENFLRFDPTNGEIRADGDAEVEYSNLNQFQVPPCPLCGSILKPRVVFFGGTVPPAVKQSSYEMVSKADKLLLVGTTASTWSCFRLVKEAVEQGKPVGILNSGPTRADQIADFKIERQIGPTIQRVATEILGDNLVIDEVTT